MTNTRYTKTGMNTRAVWRDGRRVLEQVPPEPAPALKGGRMLDRSDALTKSPGLLKAQLNAELAEWAPPVHPPKSDGITRRLAVLADEGLSANLAEAWIGAELAGRAAEYLAIYPVQLEYQPHAARALALRDMLQ